MNVKNGNDPVLVLSSFSGCLQKGEFIVYDHRTVLMSKTEAISSSLERACLIFSMFFLFSLGLMIQ